MEVIKLDTLPLSPGIYLFKDKEGTILYIGKAKSIRKRVKSYFGKHKTDWKIAALLEEHASIDFIITKNEDHALILEAQLVHDHQPKYNVLLKDGQPFLYIVRTQEPIPTLKLVRNKKEKGVYFGPFLHKKTQARSAYNYLLNIFRLRLCNAKIDNGCLDYHLGFCAGSCTKEFDMQDYLFRLDLAIDALKTDHRGYLKKIREKIAEYNKSFSFEKSRNLHEYKENLDTIFNTLKIRFSPKKYEDAVQEKTGPKLYVAPTNIDINKHLQEFLGLEHPVSTIDCFDVSHFQSNNLVGSCIRFKDGKPDKNNFRRFNIKSISQQDDYAALQEIVSRRYRDPQNIPDLILIDGGKGQLNAVKKIVPPSAACISLAKREETLFTPNHPEGIKINTSSEIGRLLIALRDYAHHFAISFHRTKRVKGLGHKTW